MIEFLTTLVSRLTILLAMGVTPVLCVRLVAPRAGLPLTLALAGGAAVMLNTAVPVLLDLAQVPICAASLLTVHWILALALYSTLRLRRMPLHPGTTSGLRAPIVIALSFWVMVLPVTYLAGIDTYKWQDLASSVAVQQCVPWVVHPLSLFGFTPRAYPSAQPLLLATLQILGHTGVDGGFFLMSVVSSAVGICGAYALGRHIFAAPSGAAWFTFLYVYSPVFTRYNHWATGRGLMVSVLPLFLLALLKLPSLRAVLLALFSAALLGLSHKAGSVAVLLLPPAALLSLCLPRARRPYLALFLGALSLAACLALAPSMLFPQPMGSFAGVAWKSVSRFGWYLPVAILGSLAPLPWTARGNRRKLLLPLIATFPLACAAEMYGALIALPFVCAAATDGLLWILERYPARRRALTIGITAASVLAALCIVGRRSATATPRRVRLAAAFLEKHNGSQPCLIEAPGMARRQIQGYLSTCPPIRVTADRGAPMFLKPHPRLHANPRVLFDEWTDYLREALAIEDAEVQWAGPGIPVYYIHIDGEGTYPQSARELYHADNIRIGMTKPEAR